MPVGSVVTAVLNAVNAIATEHDGKRRQVEHHPPEHTAYHRLVIGERMGFQRITQGYQADSYSKNASQQQVDYL